MKVLFISSGNNKFGISAIVYNQGESLKKRGIEIDYFTVKGKGLLGYINNLLKIRKKVNNNYDLIHAHYSLSALATTIAFPKIPIIVSLMGSDSRMNFFWNSLIKFNSKFIWKHVIVKSNEMKEKLFIQKASIIPNGVDFNKFEFKVKEKVKIKLGLQEEKKYILFLSNPSRYEKNFVLAQQAINLLQNNSIELLPIYNKRHIEIADYIYASDMLLLTSLWEGSPNAVKEAMACNLPVVATNVGDIHWLFGNKPGHFLTSFDPGEIAQKIKLALKFTEEMGRTNGRQRIIELGLDSETIAKNILDVYKEVIKSKPSSAVSA